MATRARPTPGFNPGTSDWTDWKWQQRNSVRSAAELKRVFPGLAPAVLDRVRHHQERRRMQITPYYLGLIERTPDGRSPIPDDPLWRQVVPCWEGEGDLAYRYDGETENWEMPEEMVTPIAQRKYDNRVIVRMSNVCHAYCQFCYEALRTLEKKSSKLSFHQSHWSDTVRFVRDNPEIEEVILSGGEPMMMSDESLREVLEDLRGLPRPVAIRLHTRALTFNPFRVTEEMENFVRRFELNAVGLHVTHPREITPDFRLAVGRLRRITPILFANIPLLRGINDSVPTMHRLCMDLYSAGVVPHYLYHFMPFSPGAAEYRTSVRSGVDLIRALKRRITNLAVPEFVLPHHSGKHTMPLLAEQEKPPEWSSNSRGDPVIRYTNWQDQTVEYFDLPDTGQNP